MTGGAAAFVTFAVDPVPHPLDDRFAALAASKSGWMGGDSTYAVELSEHTRLWLFSDTRLLGDRWVHNCIVVEDVVDDAADAADAADVNDVDEVDEVDDVDEVDEVVDRVGLRTVLGGTVAEPGDLVEPPDTIGVDGMSRWLWSGHGVAISTADLPAHRHRLWIFYQEYRSATPVGRRGEWDFAWVRTVLVELSVPDLQVLRQAPIEDGTGVQWGAAVHRDNDDLLVYGVADEGDHKHLLLAATSASQPDAQWRYRSAETTWSTRPDEAARLLTGVSNEISILPLAEPAGGWLLITSCVRVVSDRVGQRATLRGSWL